MEQFPKKEIETLWAPWRVEYFEKEPRDMEFLTAAAQASDDAGHLEIVPRWKGDTNFMPVLGGTKTISEGLSALYDKLIEAQAKMEKERAQCTAPRRGSNRRQRSAASVVSRKVA